jgi:hypothetical protein
MACETRVESESERERDQKTAEAKRRQVAAATNRPKDERRRAR